MKPTPIKSTRLLALALMLAAFINTPAKGQKE